MTVMPPRSSLVALALVAALGCLPSPPSFAQTPASPPAVTAAVPDVEVQLAFLRTAKVVSSRPIGKGVTGALRVTLSDGTRTHDAAFQAVAKESTGVDVPKNLRRPGEMRFVDHYRYNIAAWRLAQLLGLAYMMPATVERVIGSPGALSWWVDDVLMDEEERQRTQANPPSGAIGLSRQYGRMRVFAELVRDTDRNKGNVVFTRSWQLVMLDFTRAFRLAKPLMTPGAIGTCDRHLLEGLRALSKRAVKEAVQDHLTGGEIDAVMARRDLLVGHFDRLIAEHGEAAVLY